MLSRLFTFILAGLALNAQPPQFADEKEAALGAQLAADVRRQTHAVDDPAIRDYIQSLGGQLAAQVHGGPSIWSFAVISDDVGGSTREPLAIPGGYIFISLHLIAAANDEAELAGMLAHSMAHVSERHGARMATRSQNSATIPLVYIGGWSGFPVGLAKIQRANELDADRVGLRIMSEAGYDPRAFLSYIRRTAGEERIAALEESVAGLPARNYPPNAAFARIHARARELTAQPKREPPSLLRSDPR